MIPPKTVRTRQSARSFRTLDIASSQEFKYSAGLIYGRQAFFVPYNADHIAVLELQTERFRRLSAHVRAEQCKYSAALAHGSSAYLVPSSAEDVGVLDMATESFRSIQLKATGTKWKFRGGAPGAESRNGVDLNRFTDVFKGFRGFFLVVAAENGRI